MTQATAKSPWLVRPRPTSKALLRLFCFPYAGGGASIFHGWAASLPQSVELLAVQPPGRQSRWKEEPLVSVQDLACEAEAALTPYLEEQPYAFFGHSLGAVVSFELTRRLRRKGVRLPRRLFLSGHRAPQLPNEKDPTFHLPAEEFRQELERLEGTPQEILENDELFEFMLPLLRADFEAAETYRFNRDEPLACPFTVLGGLRDRYVSREDLEAWGDNTDGPATVRMLPGGHFFLHSDERLLLQLLSQELLKLTP